jgi:hypothetical protein
MPQASKNAGNAELLKTEIDAAGIKNKETQNMRDMRSVHGA